jgi:hypothetical protein
MVNCENCGKQFATVPQLRGHNMRCRAPQMVNPQEQAKPVEPVTKYRELPKPVVEFLEREIPNWLNEFGIGQEWREDFGGYAIYVDVPKEYSTEYREETRIVWDNRTRKAKIDEEGNEITERVVFPDVRWHSLKDVNVAIKWLERVIANITSAAMRKGLRLPTARIE